MCCSSEGHRGASRILIENVEDDPALQRLVRGLSPVIGKVAIGSVEDFRELLIGQRINRKEVHKRLAYCGPGRLASASMAPCRIWAAARASTFSARLARLRSASI